MRGASSKDGKLSGNRQMVEAYDKDKGHGSSKKRHQEPSARGGESGGVHEPSGHDEIKQVAAEHGPAHTHTITRKDGGGYSSETEHEDGHVHSHEHHDTMAEAHEHGAHAMDDTDHLPMNEDQEERGEYRSLNEKRHSGSGDSSFDFLPGE